MTPDWSDQVLQDELSHISAPDARRPFSSREDVFDRLIPYHIFAEADDVEAERDANGDPEVLVEKFHQVKRKLDEIEGSLAAEGRSTRLRALSEDCMLYKQVLQHERVRLLLVTLQLNQARCIPGSLPSELAGTVVAVLAILAVYYKPELIGSSAPAFLSVESVH